MRSLIRSNGIVTGPFRGNRFRVLVAARVVSLAAALSLAAGIADAQTIGSQLGGYVTLTSDLRYRGLSESRGEPSVQIGADYQHRTGLFGGAWAASVEPRARGPAQSDTHLKLGYYAGYARRIERWSLAATATRYTYRDTPIDYDYTEVSASAGFRDTLFVAVSYTRDLFSRGAEAFNAEIGLAFPLPAGLELDATLGRLDSDERSLRYTHTNAGLSRTFARRVGLDLRYYDTSRYYSNAVATSDGDAWVLSATIDLGRR